MPVLSRLWNLSWQSTSQSYDCIYKRIEELGEAARGENMTERELKKMERERDTIILQQQFNKIDEHMKLGKIRIKGLYESIKKDLLKIDIQDYKTLHNLMKNRDDRSLDTRKDLVMYLYNYFNFEKWAVDIARQKYFLEKDLIDIQSKITNYKRNSKKRD